MHLWADKFDGTLDDIFDLYDQVASAVAGAVEPNLREAEIDRCLRKPTTSLDAYDLYMRGLAAFRNLLPDSLRVTMELTRRAIDLDPHCAISSMGGSIDTALAASQRALMLNPNGFPALQHNGWIQCIAGNPAAAIDPFTRALRMSPRDPFLGYCEAGLGVAYRDVGRPQEALVWAQRAAMSTRSSGKSLHRQKRQRLVVEEIAEGRDELGGLPMGHRKGACWHGSQLDIHETRELTPFSNATSVQVCAPALLGVIWGVRESRPRHRRGRRDGLRAQPRNLHALSRSKKQRSRSK